MEALKRTPLYQAHISLGAKMVAFAGWAMPLQFAGIIEEHQAVRGQAGVFDVSHMGRVWARGPQAASFFDKTLVSDIANLPMGHAQYTLLCREDGGILDDAILYHLASEEFLLVCNAANREKDLAWLKQWMPSGKEVILEDRTEATAMVALQGPQAASCLEPFWEGTVKPQGLGSFAWEEAKIDKISALVSRTGYTGEDGFEIILEAHAAQSLWQLLIERDAKPCGLGARDTLRLEAALSLHGQDISTQVNPYEAGLGWVVSLDKGPFLGQQALAKTKEQGIKTRLICFEMTEKAIPRAGYPIMKDGQAIGKVTSGGYSPTLKKGIGMGYVPTGLSALGVSLQIDIRGTLAHARIVRRPFYKRGVSE